jgi:hypothetical protein
MVRPRQLTRPRTTDDQALRTTIAEKIATWIGYTIASMTR